MNYEHPQFVRDPAIEIMKQRTLDYLKARLAEASYPDYPPQPLRLWVARDELDAMTDDYGRLALPEGTWSVKPYKELALPNPDQIYDFADRNLKFDTYNRPLHPWIEEMITNPDLGVVTGNGFYWNWGPNYTADTIVRARDTGSILLITRGDTGQWALPGGFIDPSDPSTEDAAYREVLEETGVDLSDIDFIEVYEGPVGDIRTTANAWSDTTAFLAEVDREIECAGQDDAIHAAWVPESEVAERLNFGSHSLLVELALKQVIDGS